MRHEAVTLLVVDDDDVDIEAIRRGLLKAEMTNPVRVCRDGIQALDALRGMDGQPAVTRPYLILLDLNMPRMNGLEFLAELRDDDNLNDSVVFVLTTSKSEEDITAAYRSQIAGYIVKSNTGEDFIDLVGLLDHYWRIVELRAI